MSVNSIWKVNWMISRKLQICFQWMATILCVCGMLGLVDPLECDIDKRESQFNAC